MRTLLTASAIIAAIGLSACATDNTPREPDLFVVVREPDPPAPPRQPNPEPPPAAAPAPNSRLSPA